MENILVSESYLVTVRLAQILKAQMKQSDCQEHFQLWHKDAMKLIGNGKKSYKIQISFHHWNQNDFSMTLQSSVLIFNFYYYCVLPPCDSRSAQFSERSEVKYRFTLPIKAKKKRRFRCVHTKTKCIKEIIMSPFVFVLYSYGIILLTIFGVDQG